MDLHVCPRQARESNAVVDLLRVPPAEVHNLTDSTMRKIWDCDANFDVLPTGPSQLVPNDEAVQTKPDGQATTIAIFLLPGFSMLGLTAFLSPFKDANSISGKKLFRWVFASDGGNPVTCSLGFERSVTKSFSEVKPGPAFSSRIDFVVLTAGSGPETQCSFELSRTIRLLRRQKVPVVALGNATWLLAQAGVLEDTFCTIHWTKLAAFVETFNGPKASDAIFVEDDGVWTCAGELAAFDLAIRVIEREVGRAFTEQLCRHNVGVRPRNGASRQMMSAWLALGGVNDKLVEAIRMMEQNINEPIELQSVACRLKVSRRQLERLFMSHVRSSPSKFYLRLRLDRARQLIEQTQLPLIDIAVACGFVSTSHFSKCFREYFGMTPTETRRSCAPWIGSPRTTSRPLSA